MIDIRSYLVALIAALAFASSASAQPGSSPAAPSASAVPSAAASELADGEVRKVDKEGRKLTLRHGALKNLDMPSMTMVFQVKEEAMLDKVQAGDRVRFQAEKIDGKFTVTRLEAAR